MLVALPGWVLGDPGADLLRLGHGGAWTPGAPTLGYLLS